MSLEQLRVRNGDEVTASGTVIAVPGRPVRFCAPAPSRRPGRPGPERPPDRTLGVDLVGADLDRLTEPKTFETTRWGRAAITGRYADGTVTVTTQGPPLDRSHRRTRLPDGTPCPPPAGGWQPGPLDHAGIEALSTLVSDRPIAYGEVVMTYPDGPGLLDSGATEVLMVTITLPPATAELELRAHFTGNLCVRPAVRSRGRRRGLDPAQPGRPRDLASVRRLPGRPGLPHRHGAGRSGRAGRCRVRLAGRRRRSHRRRRGRSVAPPGVTGAGWDRWNLLPPGRVHPDASPAPAGGRTWRIGGGSRRAPPRPWS